MGASVRTLERKEQRWPSETEADSDAPYHTSSGSGACWEFLLADRDADDFICLATNSNHRWLNGARDMDCAGEVGAGSRQLSRQCRFSLVAVRGMISDLNALSESDQVGRHSV